MKKMQSISKIIEMSVKITHIFYHTNDVLVMESV
jgi:hypothetical protein